MWEKVRRRVNPEVRRNVGCILAPWVGLTGLMGLHLSSQPGGLLSYPGWLLALLATGPILFGLTVIALVARLLRLVLRGIDWVAVLISVMLISGVAGLVWGIQTLTGGW